MVSDKIKVNTTRLNSDQITVELDIKKIKNEINNLKTTVNQLYGMWDGPAKEAFKQAVSDDMEAINTVIKNLEKITSFEEEAKKKYESCEKNVSGLISGMKI